MDLFKHPKGHIVGHGEITGSLSAAQIARDLPCSIVALYGRADNNGVVSVGNSTAVTIPDGTTNITAGIPVSAGQSTLYMTVRNLNDLACIFSDASDSLLYIAFDG